MNVAVPLRLENTLSLFLVVLALWLLQGFHSPEEGVKQAEHSILISPGAPSLRLHQSWVSALTLSSS